MAKKKREDEMTSKEVETGAIVTEPGSAAQYHTGDWRSQRPIVEPKKCIRCAVCYLFCPEGCIGQRTPEAHFQANLDYCKGCGICARECPTGAITIVPEEE